MGEWEPIETAPKDETNVLLYFPGEYAWDCRMRSGWWYEDGWYDSECASNRMTDLYGEPSHWQPLPLPPSPTEADK